MSKKTYRQKQKANAQGPDKLGASAPLEVNSEEAMAEERDALTEEEGQGLSPEESTGEPSDAAINEESFPEEENVPIEEQATSEETIEEAASQEETIGEEAPQEETIGEAAPQEETKEETATQKPLDTFEQALTVEEPLQEEELTAPQAEEATSEGDESLPLEDDFIVMDASPKEEEGAQEAEETQEEEPQESENTETQEEPEDGPKVHITKWIYIGACAAVLAICFLAFLIHARREPISVTKQYLSSIQVLDFDTMESLLVDDDLTPLASADLGNPIYAEFFKDVNSKMTYAITKTQFRLGSDIAKVNARIHHIDGTQLYEKVLNQFLLDIVSSAFSGETVAQEETQEKLVALLTQFSAELPDQYSDTEISYQLEKTEDGWKISSLDDQTVKVMSANFKSIENEIQAILSGERPANNASRDVSGGSLSNSLIDLTSSEVLHISNEKYEVMFNGYKFVDDYAGQKCLLYYYYFTNKSSDPSSAMVDLDLKVFQNGSLLSEAIPNQNEPALDHYYSELGQGETALVCQAFSLKDDSNLSVQVTDPSGNVSSQIIRLQ